MPDVPEQASESLTALSRFLVGETTLRELLQRVAELGQRAISSDMVGVTLLEDGRPKTAVFTDPDAPEIDSVQYETGEGPCLDAYRHRQVYRVDSTESDRRWPSFASAAAERGVLSSLSVPLIVEDRGIGGLNFYARPRAAFDERDERTAGMFAEHAAVAIANAQAYWGAYELSQQLSEAIASRATIEQAKGILMGAQGCTADQAFGILRRASQNRNAKLRDIAADIVSRAQKKDG